jgi:catechol O-methyltransferase
MQLWRFLMPQALGFSLRAARETLVDRITNAPPRVLRARDYVATHAQRGNPQDVLLALDRYATEVRFLMSVGPEKGPLLGEVAQQLPANPRILELGAYCGYSSILMAGIFGPDAAITSIEINEHSVESATDNVEFAGLSSQVKFILGSSTKIIPTLEGPFDLVFLDHWKDLYLTDLKLIETSGLLGPGSIVVADNVGEIFGAAAYLDYVRGCGHYKTESRAARIEYSNVPDAVEIAYYQPQ